MKYFTTYNSKEDQHYTQLLLENDDDLNVFKSYDEIIRSKQAVNFWIAFKTQTGFIRSTAMEYYQHEKECKNTILQALMSTWMDLSREPVKLVDYCKKADNILAEKYHSMQKYLSKGIMIRVNAIGGFSPYECDMFKEENLCNVDTNEQVCNFILTGKLEDPMFINKDTIVLENADFYPNNLVSDFCKITKEDKNNIQVFNTFKLRTILWNKVDYLNFFSQGIENGLKNLVFESTFQDMKQFDSMKLLLSRIMKRSNNTLNIYIKTYNKKFQKILAEENIKNINIVNIN